MILSDKHPSGMCHYCQARLWLAACPGGVQDGKRHRKDCNSFMLDPFLARPALEYAALRMAAALEQRKGR